MVDNPELQSGIYCIRSSVSGRVYVGSATSFQHRWTCHRYHLRRGSHHSIILQRSWNRDGADSISFEILEFVPDATQLLNREQFWIDQLGAIDQRKGFNTAPTAGSQLGIKFSEATRAKMSASGKKAKRHYSEAERESRRVRAIARNKSPEHIEKMRASKKGGKASLETRRKMSAVRMGRKLPRRPPDQCERYRLAALAREQRKRAAKSAHQLVGAPEGS